MLIANHMGKYTTWNKRTSVSSPFVVCVGVCTLMCIPVYKHTTHHICIKQKNIPNVKWLSPGDEAAGNLYLYISQNVYNKHILFL